MVESPTLHALMRKAEDEIPFNGDSYAALDGASHAERDAFAVRHLTLHLMQALGKLAGVCGNVEHEEPLDMKTVAGAVPETLIYLLRLAGVAGVSSPQLAGAIDAQYKEWERMYG